MMPIVRPALAIDDYWGDLQHVRNYLAKARHLPYRRAGDLALGRCLPMTPMRVLDLGTGDGHLIAFLLRGRPKSQFTGVDMSPHMLTAARRRFGTNPNVLLYPHDLNKPLRKFGTFDAIVSSLATHHLSPKRLKALYSEVFEILEPGGIFCNIDHVAADSDEAHYEFYAALGEAADCFDDIHSKPPSASYHLQLLRELEFRDVACRWRWLEMALIVASRAVQRDARTTSILRPRPGTLRVSP